MNAVVAFSIPVPPSVNNLFVNVPKVGRVKSKAYREWITAAGWMLRTQRPGSINGPFAVTIRLPVKVRSDLDNLAKPILDLMVAHKITSDDRRCEDLHITKTEGIENACVSVRPWEG
jgi:Holliday junction resolvase RusA-like endonuclease